jgi:hypothetical protein
MLLEINGAELPANHPGGALYDSGYMGAGEDWKHIFAPAATSS